MKTSTHYLSAVLFSAAATAQLPPAYTPPENPTTPAKVLLGKALFWEEQLSVDDTVACGTCHAPEAGGSDPRVAAHPGADGVFGTEDDGIGSPGIVAQDAFGNFVRASAFGVERQATGRFAPTNLGASYHNTLFWDGRAESTFVDPETGRIAIVAGGALESQALGPIMSPVEMGGRSWGEVRDKLTRAVPLRLASDLPADLAAALAGGAGYPDLFAAAFGDPAITSKRIAFALASYQRSLVPDQTPWDRFNQGDTAALTPDQVTGMNMFFGAARCGMCHTAPLFTDDQFHNLGLRPADEDLGREGHSGVEGERAAFKTPTLRNAGLRPRLFHNGQSPALGTFDQVSDVRSVANIYLRGGGADRSNLDPFLLPLVPQGINLQDLELVLDFVQHGLTDPRAAQGLPPFDHPTLRSQTVPEPLRFGPALAGSSEPGFITTTPTFVGNGNWKLGLTGGDGDSLGVLFYSASALTPAMMLGSIPVNIGDENDYVAFVLRGAPGSAGMATWHLPIPAAPEIAGLTGYFQLFALDAASPAGITASRGLRLTIE